MSYQFELKYKVGDVVKVRGDLVVGKRYGLESSVYFTLEMKKYKGGLMKISKINAYNKKDGILLCDHNGEDTGYTWTLDMLEKDVDSFSLKSLLTNGTFGVTNFNEKFVVVDDKLVFQTCGHEYIDEFDEHLDCGTYKIEGLAKDCISFEDLEESIVCYDILECCKQLMQKPKEKK